MAEFAGDETLSNNVPNLGKVECAVCLQTSVHPAELPCGHIFCYLCIKGIVNQGRRCAMCRQDIPVDYLDKPRLLNPVEPETISEGFEDGHLWFYEGHNGWWQYDERTNLELESSYQKGERCCDLLIAGYLYVADFNEMLQYRRSDPSRRRRIKRDLATTTKKGIAGLKATKNCNLTSLNSLEITSNNVIQNLSSSNSSILNGLGSIRIFTSGSNNSSRHRDRIQAPQRSRGMTSGCSLPNNRTIIPTNSDAVSQTDSSNAYSTNLNLDNAMHDTLDWTIDQIELLNLELLNDYESVSAHVNNYEPLQDRLNWSCLSTYPQNYCLGNSLDSANHALDLSHSRNNALRNLSLGCPALSSGEADTILSTSPNNCMSRCLSVRNPQNDCLGNSIDSANHALDLSHSGNNALRNLSLGNPALSSGEGDTIYSDLIDTISDESSFRPVVGSPQPPPRNRGIDRSGSRGDTLRRSSGLNCDTLLQRFIFNK